MATMEEFNQLVERIDRLEALMKDFIGATHHNHYWNTTGSHDTQDVKRRCRICDKHQKYIYPMIPYEDRWEDCYEESSSR